MLNRCEFIGNIGNPPEVRFVNGTAVADFSIACNEKWKDKNGQTQDRTEWVRCTAWGKLAEVCGQYLSKGRQVYVSGRMQTDEYTDKENIKRYSTKIICDTMKMLGKREDGGGRPAEQQRPAVAPPTINVPAPAKPSGPGDLFDEDLPF